MTRAVVGDPAALAHYIVVPRCSDCVLNPLPAGVGSQRHIYLYIMSVVLCSAVYLYIVSLVYTALYGVRASGAGRVFASMPKRCELPPSPLT